MHMVKTEAKTRPSLQASHRKRAEKQKQDYCSQVLQFGEVKKLVKNSRGKAQARLHTGVVDRGAARKIPARAHQAHTYTVINLCGDTLASVHKTEARPRRLCMRRCHVEEAEHEEMQRRDKSSRLLRSSYSSVMPVSWSKSPAGRLVSRLPTRRLRAHTSHARHSRR